MVQVIENRTDLDAIVSDRRAHPTLPGFDLLTVDVRGAAPVAGVADLLSARVGDRLEIAVGRHLLPPGDLTGWSLRARAAMAGPDVVRAEANPTPGTFAVTPPAGSGA